ncbi:sugar ABC transporter substrate-binding protein, partial [Rhizobium leguminosarum bv. viciae]
MNRFLTTTAMIALALGGASVSAQAADVKEVQMLHWWTSGGEAAALNVL